MDNVATVSAGFYHTMALKFPLKFPPFRGGNLRIVACFITDIDKKAKKKTLQKTLKNKRFQG